MTKEERMNYLEQWTALSAKTEVLRIWKVRRIVALPEDYYDALILEKVEKLQKEQESYEYILAAQVVGEIVAGMDEFIDYFFLEYRIRQLVYKGVFEIKEVPKSMRDYRIKLK